MYVEATVEVRTSPLILILRIFCYQFLAEIEHLRICTDEEDLELKRYAVRVCSRLTSNHVLKSPYLFIEILDLGTYAETNTLMRSDKRPC